METEATSETLFLEFQPNPPSALTQAQAVHIGSMQIAHGTTFCHLAGARFFSTPHTWRGIPGLSTGIPKWAHPL